MNLKKSLGRKTKSSNKINKLIKLTIQDSIVWKLTYFIKPFTVLEDQADIS